MIAVAERISDYAIESWLKGVDEVADWLEKLGHKITMREQGGFNVVSSVSGITTGMINGMDPVTSVVIIMMVVFGPLWAQIEVGKQAFKMAGKKWKKQRKELKAEFDARPKPEPERFKTLKDVFA